MKEKKIKIIIGTKAQLIKMAPIMAELKRRDIEYDFVWTGQHKETIEEIIKNFNIAFPNEKLYQGEEIKSLHKGFVWFSTLLGKGLINTLVKKKESKGIVLIHGDAVSALIGLIYGKSEGYKIGHIEAGLRSFKYSRPFPEEIVRVIISKYTDYHFAPGKWAASNLKKRKGVIINTYQNTLLDSLNLIKEETNTNLGKFGLVSMHRFENIHRKKKLLSLVNVIKRVSKKIKLVFVLHPSTKHQLDKYKLNDELNGENIIVLKRQNYTTFINLLKSSEFLITDGGSNQEETSYLGHPCLLLRKETERKEGLEKNVFISSLDENAVMDFVENYGRYKSSVPRMFEKPSKIIVDFLVENGYGK